MTKAAANASVGVITTDAALTVLSCDAWLADARGIADTEIVGRNLLEVAPEIAERGLLPRIQRVLTEGTVQVLAPAFHHYLLRCATSDGGEYFDVMQQHVTITPLRHQSAISGVVITIEDVTARCVRERQLAEELKSQDAAIRLRAARKLSEKPHDPTPLFNVLGDSNWQVRRAAVVGIAQRADDDLVKRLVAVMREQHTDIALLNSTITALSESQVDVTPALIELLRSPEANVRMYTALALGNMRDPRAVQPLLELLTDEDLNVRYHAIEALGRIRSRTAAAPLLELVRTRDPFLSFAAVDALALIGEPSAMDDLLQLVDDDVLGGAAIDALASIGNERAAAPLVDALHKGASASSVSKTLAGIYNRIEQDYGEGQLVADIVRSRLEPKDIERVIASLRTADDQELAAATQVIGWLDFPGMERILAGLLPHSHAGRIAQEALVRLGARAVPTLIEEMRHDDAAVRKTAATALDQIGSADAVNILTEALNDSSADVAMAAAAALGGIGDARAFEPLLNLLDDDDGAVRAAAVAAINSIGHPETPRIARTLLDADNEKLREAGAKIAGYFGYDDCLDVMLDLLDDKSDSVRRAVVEHLAHFNDARVVSAMAEVLNRDSAGVRAAAVRAMSHLDADNAHPHLLTALNDADPRVRYHAVQSIAAHQLEGVAPRLRELVEQDPAMPVRIAAAQALGELRDSTAAPVLAQLVEDKEADLACAAIAALGNIPGAHAETALALALSSDDARRQLAALRAIADGGQDTLLPHVQKLVQRTRRADVRSTALSALARNGGSGLDAVLELSATPELTSDCVSALAAADHAYTPQLARALRHPNARVRWTAVESLARMKRVSASRELSIALHDEDPTVRFATSQALARLDLV